MITFFSVRNGDRIRLDTLSRDEAVRHAQMIYREENVISEIFEIDHEPKTETRLSGRRKR